MQKPAVSKADLAGGMRVQDVEHPVVLLVDQLQLEIGL